MHHQVDQSFPPEFWASIFVVGRLDCDNDFEIKPNYYCLSYFLVVDTNLERIAA
jgi:hypothetical protein